MNRLLLSIALAPALALAAGVAQAEWRCDCTKVTGSCSAQVEVQGNWVNVESSSQSCSRVDYFLDGQPFVTVVVDGEDRQNWLARTESPEVLVQSCQVCQDNLLAPGARAAPATGPAPAETLGDQSSAPVGLAPLIQMQPEYPPAARAQGLEGYVVVEFTVLPDGTLDRARVVESRPSGTFDRAALDAIAGYRYSADDQREPVEVRERVDFQLAPQRPRPAANAAISLEPTPPSDRPARDGRVLPRNECIRETAAFDFVDRVEVQLVNGCREPVIVYACAAGLGRFTGQWDCSADRNVALVESGDARVGERGLISSSRETVRIRYQPSYELRRPPGSAYWWIGCALNDLDCHEAARGWRNYLHLKPAEVDPRLGTSITVTASR